MHHILLLTVCLLGVVAIVFLVQHANSGLHLTQIRHPRHPNERFNAQQNQPNQVHHPQKGMHNCTSSHEHGWCVDRQGKGKCVKGFLDGPFDPGEHCANWWFQGMCLNGPLCRRTDVVPQPSTERGAYHHPAPYDYRTMPWNDGAWCEGDRCYNAPVVLAKVKQS